MITDSVKIAMSEQSFESWCENFNCTTNSDRKAIEEIKKEAENIISVDNPK